MATVDLLDVKLVFTLGGMDVCNYELRTYDYMEDKYYFYVNENSRKPVQLDDPVIEHISKLMHQGCAFEAQAQYYGQDGMIKKTINVTNYLYSNPKQTIKALMDMTFKGE